MPPEQSTAVYMTPFLVKCRVNHGTTVMPGRLESADLDLRVRDGAAGSRPG
jgi:hypothetical protein